MRGWLESIATNEDLHSTTTLSYTHFLDEDGFLIDDMIFAVVSETEILGVPNASMIDATWSWFTKHLPSVDGSVTIENLSEETAIMALQGPDARTILDAALGDGQHVGRFKWRALTTNALGDERLIQGTGYTGEAGTRFLFPTTRRLPSGVRSFPTVQHRLAWVPGTRCAWKRATSCRGLILLT